jgi:hypothetical protein
MLWYLFYQKKTYLLRCQPTFIELKKIIM